MKKKKTYEKMIETLRDVKPILGNPQELTDQIMNHLSKHQLDKKKGITISDNAGRWNVFIGFRTVAAVAAVFLVGFFAFQQWEIMSKMSRLEEVVNNQKYAPGISEQADGLKSSYFKVLLEKHATSKNIDFIKSLEEKDPLTIHGYPLNQLIQKIEQLEDENRQLKALVLSQFVDSLRKYRINTAKTKSL